MAEYTYADVIIDPDDPRVEIGKEYYFGDNPTSLLYGVQHNWPIRKLEDVSNQAPSISPFYNGSSFFACLIRKKEPVKKYVPFDLSKEEDRARLRGAWVRHKQNPERENLITGLGDETVDFAVYFGDVAVGTGVLLENFEFVDGSPCGKLVEEKE